MAEALLKELALQERTPGLIISSCGLQASPWTIAKPQLSIVIGNAYRFLKDFHSRPISSEIVRNADLLLTMEDREVKEILARFPDATKKVSTVNAFSGRKGEIRDFVNSSDEDLTEWLRECHSMLSSCLPKILERIRTNDLRI